ncbi:motility associated factor glycosyltransferase family protein [Poriferisphaera sp. WC338]|uniref:motility associated factor glycosyltransferase family protein n=1 Tax=Poriferisphaera sp. WC338 TaxID=3425129 RepID=UPI003D81B2D9
MSEKISQDNLLPLNLALLQRHSAELADRVRAVEVGDEVVVGKSKTEVATGAVVYEGRGLALCSKYDPVKEGERIAEGVDYGKAATVVLMGLGMGYQASEISKRMGPHGLLVVWEPDVRVLRAALEHVDQTAWLSRKLLVLLTGQVDRAVVHQGLEKYSAIITQGLHLQEHPTYRQTHGEAVRKFSSHIQDMVAYARTNVATLLVNTARTCRNLASNLPVYSSGASINELEGIAKGYPAVCVAAGPSLVKNVHLLKDPEIRKRVVVIAVQTALRPLLDRGVKPDFVTALDYSQISARFYENLPPLPDVTLVAEPKAHCSILDSFPGPVRVLRNEFNDTLLGDMKENKGSLPSGGTVAHLSFYLAQYLGCDPIMLIGQDLGFSDGLYYAPGTAVHRVWSSEFNQFNSVEMMEWVRVVRMRGHLQPAEDVHGKQIYSDEQMLTYLKQFEKDFAQAEQLVIDATEGGCKKEHTMAMSLAEAIEKYATKDVPTIPMPKRELDGARLDRVREMIEMRQDDIDELRKVTNSTLNILRQMKEHQRNAKKMNKLFDQMNEKKEQVFGELGATFKLVTRLNSVGAFKRMKHDRQIQVDELDKYEKQLRQLERDEENLDWIVQSADEARKIFAAAHQRVCAASERVKEATCETQTAEAGQV